MMASVLAFVRSIVIIPILRGGESCPEEWTAKTVTLEKMLSVMSSNDSTIAIFIMARREAKRRFEKSMNSRLRCRDSQRI